MSCPNADLIAVSLACPKDPTSPYRMHMGPPTESSVRNLLEKVGNLRDIAVLVQLNLAFLTFIDLHLRGQTVSDYHPLFFKCFFCIEYFRFFWIHVCIYSLILKLVSMHPKIILENKWVTYFKKSKGWRFDFRGPKLF